MHLPWSGCSSCWCCRRAAEGCSTLVSVVEPSLRQPVADVLARFHPSGSAERADVARVHELLRASDDPWSRKTPLHITSSAVVVHPPTRRILLRWHPRQKAWLQLGGHADPGESEPIDIALREGREETGLPDLVPWPDASLLHVVIVPVPAHGDEPAHEHADLRFVLATSEPEAARAERPDAPVRWLSVPEALELTSEANLQITLSRVANLLQR